MARRLPPVRHRPDGTEDPHFVLNIARFPHARILLAGENFGCGSSRENAVRALDGFGIRCVIALGFSDIFRENAFKNGLLPIELPRTEHAPLAAAAAAATLHLTVDVAAKHIALPSDEAIPFALDARRQASLLAGADEIAETLRGHDRIERFREGHRLQSPWLYSAQGGGSGATKRRSTT